VHHNSQIHGRSRIRTAAAFLGLGSPSQVLAECKPEISVPVLILCEPAGHDFFACCHLFDDVSQMRSATRRCIDFLRRLCIGPDSCLRRQELAAWHGRRRLADCTVGTGASTLLGDGRQHAWPRKLGPDDCDPLCTCHRGVKAGL